MRKAAEPNAETRRAVRDRLDRWYADEAVEPWAYGQRAGEILRHAWVAATVKSMIAGDRRSPQRVLDVGCSLGHVSTRLRQLSIALTALDVSINAVRRAAMRVRAVFPTSAGPQVEFIAGSVVEIPARDEWFDIIVASDGLYSWDLSPADRALALVDLHRVLNENGRILFTDHMRHYRFDAFVAEIESGGFRVERVEYLFDRPWYQFESWLRAVHGWRAAKALRRNAAIARALRVLGRIAGRPGSRHVCVVATRRAPPL